MGTGPRCRLVTNLWLPDMYPLALLTAPNWTPWGLGLRKQIFFWSRAVVFGLWTSKGGRTLPTQTNPTQAPAFPLFAVWWGRRRITEPRVMALERSGMSER